MEETFKAFHDMTPADYAALGFRCGLEVHQQLDTRTKLFCRCPAGRYSPEYHAEILRHMRPTLSELGEYDGTALMEKKTKKNICYRVHSDTVCTYEFDDTPPFMLAEDALDIALQLALLLRLNLVDELHIARKQYLDGSIPTGFQRTTILGIDGWIPYRDRHIGIRQLGLEEDSCREVSDHGHDRVYLTDRLGMPLIEVVTEPDMCTPQEAADVGQIIRRLCRSTLRVRTGYGAARQDVNVSITGGTRIEIKGVPQIKRIPHLVYNEARRQWSLLRIRDELRSRGITADTFAFHTGDVSRLLFATAYEPIRAALNEGQRVMCVVLHGFAGMLRRETQEHTTFAKEFSDRARVIACLTRLPNMIHSDAASESLLGRDWQRIRKKLRVSPQDAMVLVWGGEQDTATACEEIAHRAREATVGVPSDTRQALRDGTNGFERVLPGAERMYPDTDLPPLAVADDRLERARCAVPEFVWDREARYRQLGVPETLVEELSVSPRAKLFDRLVAELDVNPTLAAVVLCERLKALTRVGLAPGQLSDDEVVAVFFRYRSGRLAREGIVRILRRLLSRPASETESAEQRVEKAVAELDLQPVAEDLVEQRLAALPEEIPSSRFGNSDQRYRFIMGALMREWRGRIDGARLALRVGKRLATSRSAPSAGVPS